MGSTSHDTAVELIITSYQYDIIGPSHVSLTIIRYDKKNVRLNGNNNGRNGSFFKWLATS